jgi:ADP-ribosyl-[dinitrogen reductase] hydrolase
MSIIPDLASRIQGSIHGVAVVDALGGPVEFKARGTFAPVDSYRKNNNFGLEPGLHPNVCSFVL